MMALRTVLLVSAVAFCTAGRGGNPNKGGGGGEESVPTTEKTGAGCQTAWAKGSQGTCFTRLMRGGRWGWTSRVAAGSTETMELWAGAGRCNTAAGYLAGTVSVTFNETWVAVSVAMANGWRSIDAALYVGVDPLPQLHGRYTVAPGQFALQANGGALSFNASAGAGAGAAGAVWVALHVNVCTMPPTSAPATVAPPTPAPATSVPATAAPSTSVPVPPVVATTSAPATATPTTPAPATTPAPQPAVVCASGEWRVPVALGAVGLTADCNLLCAAESLTSVCEVVCECVPTPPATATPTTPAPSVPVPPTTTTAAPASNAPVSVCPSGIFVPVNPEVPTDCNTVCGEAGTPALCALDCVCVPEGGAGGAGGAGPM